MEYYKVFEYLPQDAVDIRTAVFVEEQGFQNEFDEHDSRALHLVAYTSEEKPVAVCRIMEDKNGIFLIGRIAVIKEFRGRGIGKSIVREAEKVILGRNGNTAMLHAQCRAKSFYNKLDYFECGDVEDEEGCPHIWMKKVLGQATL